MGWADCGVDSEGRPIGYGFVAACDHPGCEKAIDRGLAYACGGMHGSPPGCEEYFCYEHLCYSVVDDEEGFFCFACGLIEDEEEEEADMNCNDNMECIDCAEFPQDPGTAFIVPGKCRAGLITTGSTMEACERFDPIKNEIKPVTEMELLVVTWANRCNNMVGDLRQLVNQWRADVDQWSADRSITSKALLRCCNDLDDLIESWERGNYENQDKSI